MKIGEIVRASGRERRKSLIGRTFPVLLEGVSSKNPDELMGRTPAGYVVVFPSVNNEETGTVKNVKLEELSGFTLRGTSK